MNEMIERVARAICEAATHMNPPPQSMLWENYVAVARASIAAMREPTEAMIDAAWDNGRNDFECDPITTFPAMIDAALKDDG